MAEKENRLLEQQGRRPKPGPYITKKKKYLNSATRCADWIIICSKKEGVINPVFDTDKNKFIYDKKSWSMISGSYHAKISIGLYNIYSITKKKIYFMKFY